MRTEPPIPPIGDVPSQWKTKKKWRVESLHAPKSTDRSYHVPNSTMVVTPSKSERPRRALRFLPAFKPFQRRKPHELVLSKVLTAMKKMNKLKKKTSKPLVNILFIILLCIYLFIFFLGNGYCSTSTYCDQSFKCPGKGETHGSSKS